MANNLVPVSAGVPCPLCSTPFKRENISMEVAQGYEPYIYGGLFGGEPEEGFMPTTKDATGKVNCSNCGYSQTWKMSTDGWILVGEYYGNL